VLETLVRPTKPLVPGKGAPSENHGSAGNESTCRDEEKNWRRTHGFDERLQVKKKKSHDITKHAASSPGSGVF